MQKSQGENTIEVVDGLFKALEAAKPLMPPGVKVEVNRDNSRSIRVSVANVKRTLFEGAALTILIVFLFLNSWRSTVITGLTLPIALIGTFLFMYMFGFTINTITMMALSLCVGLLIDDAIVVRENIVRHVQMGKSAHEAALAGTNEIGLAVLATTLSIVAVFLPIGFMGGIVGKFFHEFGLTIVAAVLISMFVSFTLDPMLSSVWHDPQAERGHGAFGPTAGARSTTARIGRVTGLFDRLTLRLSAGYQATLGWSLRHRLATLGIALATFVGSFFIIPILGAEFVPKADFSETQVNYYTPVGSSLEVTEMRARQVDAVLREMPEVRYTVTTINSGQAAGKIYAATYVRLVDRKDRKRSVTEMAVPLRERLARIPGITVTNIGQTDLGGGKSLQFSIQGTDLGELERLSKAITAKLLQIPGLVDLDTTLKPDKPTVAIEVRRDAASDVGLNVNMLANTLRTLVAGTTVGNWRAPDGENYDVNVQLAPESRYAIGDLQRMPINVAPAADGSPRVVRLSQVADVAPSTGPNQINRRDLNREINVDANAFGRSSGDVSADIKKVLDEISWPPGYRYSLRRLDQEHDRVVQLRARRARPGGRLHLHDPGEPVPQLHPAAGADELAAADADRRRARPADVPLDPQHVLDHRYRHADGPGDQERDPADRLRDPRPARRSRRRRRRPRDARRVDGPRDGPALRRRGAAAADPDDHAGDGLRHGAARLRPLRRLGAARARWARR